MGKLQWYLHDKCRVRGQRAQTGGKEWNRKDKIPMNPKPQKQEDCICRNLPACMDSADVCLPFAGLVEECQDLLPIRASPNEVSAILQVS